METRKVNELVNINHNMGDRELYRYEMVLQDRIKLMSNNNVFKMTV